MKIEAKIDENSITPSDFGIFATNLPIDVTEQEVGEYFDEQFPGVECEYVNYAYSIGTIVKLLRRLTKFRKMR